MSFFCLASELHYFFGAFFQVFQCCPCFVLYRTDAEARQPCFFGIIPCRILAQTGEDAGASGANEELTPGYFIGVFPDFPELESYVELGNQSDKTCCRWSYLGIAVMIEFIFVFFSYFTPKSKFVFFCLLITKAAHSEHLDWHPPL